MQSWLVILVFEIIPIILWAMGWYFENSFSEYPITKKGFKTKESKSSKLLWEYGNKVAGKVFSSTATILFIVIALGLSIMGISPFLMAFIIFIVLCLIYMIIDGLIKKKWKENKKK